MRMIKVDDKYLGLVDRQTDALRFPDRPINHGNDLSMIDVASDMTRLVPGSRMVKLTTLADRTADSMRALASDVLDATAGATLAESMASEEEKDK